MEYLIGLAALSAVLSGVACFLAARALLRAETRRLTQLEKLVRDVEAGQISYVELYEKMWNWMRNESRRQNMAKARESRHKPAQGDLPDPDTQPQLWESEVMKKYPRGALSIVED